jgi:predicted RNA-binding Zn ribbon-like protein
VDVTKERPDPFFIAGAIGLDFLNSVATPIDEPVEWIASGEDLLQWMKRAGLIADKAAEYFHTSTLPEELDAAAEQARGLREWFRGFVQRHKGESLKTEVLAELEPLNRLLALDEAFDQIVVRDERESDGAVSKLRLAQQRRGRFPGALLQPIGKAVAEVICDISFADIRACEGSLCSLLYVDPTRRHTRRWCSMAVCGNRSKQAAYRERSKQHSTRLPT